MAHHKTQSPGDTTHAADLAALDAAAEKMFDDLAWLAAQVCRAPIALISVASERGQRLKAKVGLSVNEASRDFTFYDNIIQRRGLVTVNDALRHKQLASHPLVTEKPNVRFVAGVPLMASDGAGVGTLLVMDRVPRELSQEQGYALEVLARQLVSHLEWRQAAEKVQG